MIRSPFLLDSLEGTSGMVCNSDSTLVVAVVYIRLLLLDGRDYIHRLIVCKKLLFLQAFTSV